MSNVPEQEVHWRDASRPVKFILWDAEAALPLVFWLLFPHVWVLEVCGISLLFFTIIAKYGVNIRVFLRMLRGVAAGQRKVAVPWWLQ